MPIGFNIGSLAAGALSLFGQGRTNKKQFEYATQLNQQQYQYNKELADRAYSQNMAAWNAQNAYNSPAAQMRRLRAAGLNPNQMYGSGVDAAGLAGDAPQLQYGDYNPKIPAFESGINSGINAAFSAEQMFSLIRLQESQADKNLIEAANTSKNTEWIDKINQANVNKTVQDTITSQFLAGNYKAMSDQIMHNIQNLDANTRKTLLESDKLQVSLKYADEYFRLANEVTKAEIDKIREETKNNPVLRAKMQSEMSLMFSQMQLLAAQTDLTSKEASKILQDISESNYRIDKIVAEEGFINAQTSESSSRVRLNDAQVRALKGECARRWISTSSSAFRDFGIGASAIGNGLSNVFSPSPARIGF